jgi:hypothetical protein
MNSKFLRGKLLPMMPAGGVTVKRKAICNKGSPSHQFNQSSGSLKEAVPRFLKKFLRFPYSILIFSIFGIILAIDVYDLYYPSR